MQQAIEIVLFNGKPGVSAEQMMAAAQKVLPRLSGLPGFVSRSFGYSPDGRYADVVHWQDMASAEAAAQAVMQCDVCAEFFALIDEQQVQMLHFHQG